MQYAKTKSPQPGKLFSLFVVAYFVFRFFIEFIRVANPVFLGLTAVQLVAVFIVLYRGKDLKLKPVMVKGEVS